MRYFMPVGGEVLERRPQLFDHAIYAVLFELEDVYRISVHDRAKLVGRVTIGKPLTEEELLKEVKLALEDYL